MASNDDIEQIKGRHVGLLLSMLRLTQGSAVIATGISCQTLSAISQEHKKEVQVSPPYALLIRLLLKYPGLCPVKPAISMSVFTDFVEQHTGIKLGDSASIMLGQQKTWYYKAKHGEALSPAASNLAQMYMTIIEHGGGLDAVRKIVEAEAKSRGLKSSLLWKKGTWPRNLSGKPIKFEVPKENNDAITSSDIHQMKMRGIGSNNELSFIDMSYCYGVTQHRMIQLAREYNNPLEMPANAALMTRCLREIPGDKIPFNVPSMLPVDIFEMFNSNGIDKPYTATVMLGIGGSNYRNMVMNERSNSYTERLGFYIAEGCKKDPKFMSKYLALVNEEAMSRGMKDKGIFETETWPINLPQKKAG